ncbi:Na+/H+ antiporter subunit E [Bosea sp. 2KB_26]|uniref:Na+/H+ antiporter subunit E n=1 Tax=Bosea sp. 2KB_26 TaxID=3237475 RepID=UPI003F927EE2
MTTEIGGTPLLARLTRGLGFLALWLILMDPALTDLPIGLIAAAAATWTSTALWPENGKLSASGLVRFLIRFVPQSAVAGIDVARRAFAPRPALSPGFVTYRTLLPPGMARSASCAVMSLQPGKLPVAADADGTLHIHCLDLREPVAEQIAADEAAFCDTLQSGGVHG